MPKTKTQPKKRAKAKKKEVFYPCTACEKTYKTKARLQKHAEKEHSQRYMVAIIENGIIHLTNQQELFCQYYVVGRDTRNNATISYAHAFGYELDKMSTEREWGPRLDPRTKEPILDKETGEVVMEEKVGTSERERAYSVCSTEASKLLKKPQIQARRVQLLNAMMREEIVDAETMDIIMQEDLKSPTKIAAIKEFNALRGRITKKEEIRLGVIGVVKHMYQRADEIEKENK
jgi:phage terminase small subunit